MMKKKTLEKKKGILLLKQNTYVKENKKNTIPEALITIKEKQLIKKETIQRMEKFGARPKTKFNGSRPCRFCNNPIWNPSHKCPSSESNCYNCGIKGHLARACRQSQNNIGTVKKLTDEVVNEPNESISESGESTPYRRNQENRRKTETLHSENENNRATKKS